MKNISDGKSDGFVFMYSKDGIMYPIALKQEELEVLDMTLSMCLTQVNLINKPMGNTVNLLKKEGK